MYFIDTEYMSGLVSFIGPEMYPKRGELCQQTFVFLFFVPVWSI